MRKRKKVMSLLTIVLVSLIIAAGVCIYFILEIMIDVTNNPEIAFGKQNDSPPKIVTPIEPSPAVAQEPIPTATPIAYDVMVDGKMYNLKNDGVNIVLFGFDDVEYRDDDGGNTDSIMVFNIGFNNNSMDIISVPRDTWTRVHEYDRNGNLEFVYKTKINAAFMAADRKKDRFPNALTTVEQLFEVDDTFDLDMDYYCSIDIKDISKVCDSLGGVPMVLDATIVSIGKKGDFVTLNNKDAQTYLRDRSSLNGDLDRAKHHRTFIIAVLKRVKALGGKNAALALYDDVLRYIDTNLGLEQIAALATMTDNIDIDSISMTTVPGATGGTAYERPGKYYGDYRSVYLADQMKMTKLMLEIYYEEVTE
jgi:polyisoprenyl-teichoic acid--peptidoglycan teichoic acid transferase